ncbi:hypothetical protein AD953_01290 [Acetobacter malorum]|uniref:Uncharacterized protein n=1 Tax=Acetobacter malorum TaxID=178901 RepID=A0A149VHQ8_9PROT|nr:hypothetical protein [Acetobacter malorum]KXV79709.1 hypothetical protein AD953_01290 [Acetobacter malorum]
MSYRTDRRRRQISRKGRHMQLMRPDESASITVMAYAPPPQAVTLEDGVSVAPFEAQITADETAAANYAPASGDWLMDNGRRYTLTDAVPVYDGSTLSGWSLSAKGGA